MLAIAILVASVIIYNKGESSTNKTTLHTLKDESEEAQNLDSLINDMGQDFIGIIGADMLYVGDTYCVYYDNHGVFRYDFTKERVTDFVSFADNGFSNALNGDEATFAYSMNHGNEMYLVREAPSEDANDEDSISTDDATSITKTSYIKKEYPMFKAGKLEDGMEEANVGKIHSINMDGLAIEHVELGQHHIIMPKDGWYLLDQEEKE